MECWVSVKKSDFDAFLQASKMKFCLIKFKRVNIWIYGPITYLYADQSRTCKQTNHVPVCRPITYLYADQSRTCMRSWSEVRKVRYCPSAASFGEATEESDRN